MLSKSWSSLLHSQMQEDYFIKLQNFIKKEYKEQTVYPKYEDIFRAFNLVDVDDVKVVIIAQDPYHGEHQANGLAFSVCHACKTPPSLKNIFKELVDDIGCKYPVSGDLTPWTKEGVLLINTVLTVRKGEANSHKAKGWEIFTDYIIKQLSLKYEHIVFVLWGGASIKKASLIDASKHLVLESVHPSPLSSYRGFFSSKPFSKANEYLKLNSKKEISWCLA